jgi:hypothetical protein
MLEGAGIFTARSWFLRHAADANADGFHGVAFGCEFGGIGTSRLSAVQ